MCCNCKNCTCGKNNKVRVCPKCGKEYKDAPAVSRESDKTLICPECGMKEALEVMQKNIKKE